MQYALLVTPSPIQKRKQLFYSFGNFMKMSEKYKNAILQQLNEIEKQVFALRACEECAESMLNQKLTSELFLIEQKSVKYDASTHKSSDEKVSSFRISKRKLSHSETSRHTRKHCFKYKMFSKDFKKNCLEKLKHKSLKEVSEECGVPLKSLKRWTIVGYERKKGGGRRIKDPEMEKKLLDWCLSQKNAGKLKLNTIRSKALEYSTFEDFKASKGWFEKFKKKYSNVLKL
jgi:hypothetical protein